MKTNNNENKTSNGWSKKKEQLLQIWMDECNIYSKLYAYNVVWYEKVDNILGIVGILLSAVTSASLLNNSNNSKNANVIILVFGLLSMVNTFIQATKEYLNLKTVINSNLIASRQNRMVCIDIESQLNFSRHERINGKDFLTNIKDRKNDLILNGPIISNRIWKKIAPSYTNYKKKVKENINKSKKNIETISSNNDSGSSSNDIVYKRRPTMEILNLDNSFNNNDISSNENKPTHDNVMNNDIHIDFIENLTIDENYSSEEDNSVYTEEDEGEEEFLREVNKANKASNEINIKLEKKPVNELDQELTRFHI
jgi:hypothetical protein